MNLYHLRYFITLAHLEHYTRAAEELGITQPSLSHAIASLEEEIGLPLFEKEGRNVVLSRIGQEFLPQVEASLSILDQEVARLQKIARGHGRVELGFLRGLGADLVPDLIRAFQATPSGRHVTFHLSTGSTSELMTALDQGTVDLTLSSYDTTAKRTDFYSVHTQRFVLVVPENHPLAQKDRINLSETLAYPHIRFDSTAVIRREIDRIYADLPTTPTIAYELQEAQDIAGLVANGLGIAVLQEAYYLSSLPVKVIQLEHEAVQRRIYLAASKRHTLSPAAEAFLRFVLGYV